MFHPAKSFFQSVYHATLPRGRICGSRRLIPIRKELKIERSAFDMYKGVFGNYTFFLDSARLHPETARYSYIGIEPFLIFTSKGSNVIIQTKDGTKSLNANPIEQLRLLFNKYTSRKIEGFPDFTGGAVGYFSYDCCHLFEKLPGRAVDDLNIPDIFLMFFDTVIAFDHLEGKAFVISNVYPDKPLDRAYDEATRRIERLEHVIARSPEELQKRPTTFGATKQSLRRINPNLSDSEMRLLRNDKGMVSTFTKEGFEYIVRRAKEYIAAGDIYQANLSQRFCADISGIEPLTLYEKLRQINPSPFACYLDIGSLKIASSSPERLLKVEDRWVKTRPIAGTRPRGKTPSEDLELSCELILSDKERAEHIMLVDLERNDLGRVCDYGTVKVNELMVLEDYSHVIHIVSNVVGRLNRRKDRFDLIRAAFPGGTITGCPKIRCMEIIDELEPVTRNIYTGSIGYLGFNGDMDLNIAIRTFVIYGNKAYVQVGAGIVADSDPTREYYETLYKAEALFRALEEMSENNQLLPHQPRNFGVIGTITNDQISNREDKKI